MNRRPGLIASGLVVLLMLVLSAWAWGQIPDGARIAVHWGLQGRPDRYGGKVEAFLLVPLVTAGVALVFWLIPLVEPRRTNLWQSARAYNAIWIGAVLVLGGLHASIVFNALGHPMNTALVALGSLGVLLVVLGNYMGKIRSNFFVGIRTPWTLSSELSWNRTHRLGGRLFMALGVVLLLATLLGNTEVGFWLLLGGLAVVVAATFYYSYLTWRADPSRQALGR